MFYLIQGIFFPSDYFAFPDGQKSCPFRGQFTLFGKNQSQGELSDFFGDSDISHIEMTDDALSFTQNYIRDENRTVIHHFLKEGNLWVGKWNDGKEKGWGNCVTIQVDREVYWTPHTEKIVYRPASPQTPR